MEKRHARRSWENRAAADTQETQDVRVANAVSCSPHFSFSTLARFGETQIPSNQFFPAAIMRGVGNRMAPQRASIMRRAFRVWPIVSKTIPGTPCILQARLGVMIRINRRETICLAVPCSPLRFSREHFSGQCPPSSVDHRFHFGCVYAPCRGLYSLRLCQRGGNSPPYYRTMLPMQTSW